MGKLIKEEKRLWVRNYIIVGKVSNGNYLVKLEHLESPTEGFKMSREYSLSPEKIDEMIKNGYLDILVSSWVEDDEDE